MTYHLGIDLGTTYTAAATHEAGRIEVVPLGDRGPSIPSVLYMRPDGNVVAGDTANRHAVTVPERIAREFKRRLGDPTPVLLAGVPTPPEMLTGHLLRWVYDTVVRAKGMAPLEVALTHPANWGTYKRDLLVRAAEAAGLSDVTLATEPQAAAISYAFQERVEPGAVVAVYDLGGGTFDAAVLRKETDGGFTILGSPEGIERLGGIDFDSAVFAHVTQALEGVFDELDPDDEATISAVARLRQECTQAKEALSLDTEAVIPVLLPHTQTEVRVTRAELEGMIRPPLVETVTAMERALRSGGVENDQVSHILLVGGSSRIPLVAQMVSSQLGRPVAVDAHPKHAIALGAAIVAARAAGVPVGDAASVAPAPPVAAPAPPPPVAAAPAPPPPAPPQPVGAATTTAPPPPLASATPSSPPAAPPPPASAPPTPPGSAAPPPPAAPAPPAYQPPSSYQSPAPPPTSSGGYTAAPPPPNSGGWDPTFDAAHREAPAPSLGYRQASAPPPPGASNDLPPGFLTQDQRQRVQKKESRKGKLVGLLLFLILVAAVAATYAMTKKSNQPKSIDTLSQGDCFTAADGGTDPEDVEAIDCAEPHHRELFKIIEAPDPEAAYPGEQALEDACLPELEAFVGSTPQEIVAAGLDLFPTVPSEARWNSGKTTSYCTVGPAEKGKTFAGSAKGAGPGGG